MRIARLLLFPVSLIYAVVVVFRNFLFDIGALSSKSYDIAIISVGNLSVGGTGKSPHVEYLVKLLQKKLNIATLSRGYGRKTTGYREVELASTSLEVGDEPKMFKQKNHSLSVHVDGNRRRGIKNILQNYPEVNCVILDDAFQHRAVQPGLSILLTSYSRLYIQDMVLPTGNLREPAAGAKRADIIIVTNCPSIFSPVDARAIRKRLKGKPYQNIFFSYYEYLDLKPVYHNEHDEEVILNRKISAVLFTGIANAGNIEYHLKNKIKHLDSIRFPDHHHFQINDIQKVLRAYDRISDENKIIITTEKDAMRLHHPGIVEMLGDQPVYFLPIRVNFHGKDQDEFDTQVLDYVRRNQKIG
jgi:tetraacyldisaccharide 4'-kinase